MTEYFQTVIILNDYYHEGDYITVHDVAEKYINLFQEITCKYEQVKIKVNDTGSKRLAYEIRGHETGYFIEITWLGETKDTYEIERHCRIDDEVLKFITVKMNEYPTLEPLEPAPPSVPAKEYADAYEIIFG